MPRERLHLFPRLSNGIRSSRSQKLTATSTPGARREMSSQLWSMTTEPTISGSRRSKTARNSRMNCWPRDVREPTTPLPQDCLLTSCRLSCYWQFIGNGIIRPTTRSGSFNDGKETADIRARCTEAEGGTACKEGQGTSKEAIGLATRIEPNRFVKDATRVSRAADLGGSEPVG